MPWLLFALVSWGALAFGSPYPWAYLPLLIGGVIVGAASLLIARNRAASTKWLAATLLLLVAAVALQLIPLPRQVLDVLSPNASAIIEQRELGGIEQSTHAVSIASSSTRLGLAFLASFGILLVGTAAALDRSRAKRLAGLLVALGLLMALIGIIQNSLPYGKVYGFWELRQGGSPFGPFINKNHFAGWMLLVIPVSIGYLMSTLARGLEGRLDDFRGLVLRVFSEQGSKATLTAFAVIVMSLSVLMTLSRSGIASLALAYVISGYLVTRRFSRSTGRTLAIGAFLVVAIGGLAWAGLDQIAWRFSQVDLAAENQRPAMWADTMRLARDFWMTGTGLNTYSTAMLFYQTSVPDLHLQAAHNDYLQLMAEGGLLLGIPIAIAFTVFVRAVRHRIREDVGSIWWIRAGAIVGLVAIAFQALFDFSLQMPGNAVLFTVVAGIALHDGRP
jgi:hypothetical protein